MSDKQITVEDIKRSFPLFLLLVWRHLRLPNPTKVQQYISDYLADDSNNKIIIEGFRGVGKSWITSAYTCWLLLNDKEKKILVVSASKDRAMNFSTFTQRLIYEVPILSHLKPRTDQRQNARPAITPALSTMIEKSSGKPIMPRRYSASENSTRSIRASSKKPATHVLN